MIQIDMEMPTDCNICPCCQSNVHFTHFTCGIITTQKPEPLIYQGFRLFLLLTCYKFNIKPGQIKTNL